VSHRHHFAARLELLHDHQLVLWAVVCYTSVTQ
jgi:hypothetical protein